MMAIALLHRCSREIRLIFNSEISNADADNNTKSSTASKLSRFPLGFDAGGELQHNLLLN